MTERIKLNEDERYGYFVRTRHRKKLLVVIVSLVLIMSLLTVRVGYIMTVRAEYYSVRATELHERERAIKAMRGRILDTNGVVLADNTTVCTISVIHSQIDKPEEVIKMLCDNLDMDEAAVRKKVEKVSSIETIKTNVDKDTGDSNRRNIFQNKDNELIDRDLQCTIVCNLSPDNFLVQIPSGKY